MEIVVITAPKGIKTAALVNDVASGASEILLQIEFAGGISDVHAGVKPLIYGAIPSTSGTYHLKVKSLNESSVEISW
jgi:hypothetical protein